MQLLGMIFDSLRDVFVEPRPVTMTMTCPDNSASGDRDGFASVLKQEFFHIVERRALCVDLKERSLSLLSIAVHPLDWQSTRDNCVQKLPLSGVEVGIVTHRDKVLPRTN